MGLFGSYQEGDSFQSESFNNEVLLKSHPKAWLVQPCHWYKDEFKECNSFHGKLHQYFIFGKTLDCQQWKTDYNNCLALRKNPADMEALVSRLHLLTSNNNDCFQSQVIESEEKRIATRLAASARNDVWTYRESPPSNWNDPLPKELQYKGFNYLKMKQEAKKKEENKNTPQ